MAKPIYQLIVVHDNLTETLPLDEKKPLEIKAKADTGYKVIKDGELVDGIITKTVGDDLYVYLPNEETPILYLTEYHHYVPVSDTMTVGELDSHFVTASEVTRLPVSTLGVFALSALGIGTAVGLSALKKQVSIQPSQTARPISFTFDTENLIVTDSITADVLNRGQYLVNINVLGDDPVATDVDTLLIKSLKEGDLDNISLVLEGADSQGQIQIGSYLYRLEKRGDGYYLTTPNLAEWLPEGETKPNYDVVDEEKSYKAEVDASRNEVIVRDIDGNVVKVIRPETPLVEPSKETESSEEIESSKESESSEEVEQSKESESSEEIEQSKESESSEEIDPSKESESSEEIESSKESESSEEGEPSKESESSEEVEPSKESESSEEIESSKESESSEEGEPSKESESSEEVEPSKETESSEEIESSKEVEPSKETESSEEIESSKESESSEEIEQSKESESSEEIEPSKESESSEDVEPSKEPESSEEVELSKEVESSEEVEPSKEVESSEDVELSKEVESSEDIEPSKEPESSEEVEPSKEVESSEDVEEDEDQITMITINPIDDGMINLADSKGNFVLSGSITLAEGATAQSVTVLVNGEEKNAQISDDGKSWRLLSSGNELAKNQGEQSVIVKLNVLENGTLTTKQGATSYTVDTQIEKPVIAFNAIAEDDVINLAESKQQAVKISGKVANAHIGDKVMLTIGEAVREVDIQSNGEFELLVGTEALINHRSILGTVLTKDSAGNSASASETKSYKVDIEPPTPTITLNKVTGDNVVDFIDMNKPLITLTGSIASFDPEDTKNVVLTLCGCATCTESRKTLQATLNEDGSFSADVMPADLLQYSKVVATISSKDEAGNVGADVSASQEYKTLATLVSPPELFLNPIAVDNFVNTTESTAKVRISGRIDNAQDRALQIAGGVQLQFIKDGNVVFEQKVPFDKNPNSTLAAPLPSFVYEIEGSELQKYDTVKASFTDRSGKVYSDSESYVYAAYSPSWGNVSLSNVAVDSVIDSQEALNKTAIVRGSYNVTPNASMPIGVNVYVDLRLNVNGRIYTKRVDGVSGEFEIEVATRDLVADSDKVIHLSATLRDTAGNTGGSRNTRLTYKVQDTEITQPEITIDPITTINQAYIAQHLTTRISGTANTDSDVPVANQHIVLMVNGREYSVTRDGNKWFADIETSALLVANGNVSAQIRVSDLAGNRSENSTTQTYLVDVTPPTPKIVLNQIGDNNVLSATALTKEIVISGNVSGDYAPTDKVKLQIGTTSYDVSLENGSFRQAVNPEVLRANSRVSAQLDSRDEVGNLGSAEASQDYQVQAADIQIHFAKVTTDNLINVTERSSENITVSGHLSGTDIGLAKTVLLTINGVQHRAILGDNASFSVQVSGKALLDNSNYRIEAQVLDDRLQVQATQSHQYQVQDRAAADIRITNVDDEALSVGQVFGAVRVSGKLNFNDSLYKQGYNSDAIKTLVVTIDGKDYAAGFNRDDFSFHFDIKRSEYETFVGKPISYKLLTNNAQELYYLTGTETHKTVNTLKRNNAQNAEADRETKATELAKISVEFDGKTIIGNVVQPFKQQTTVSGIVSGTAKAGDMVEISIGDKTYQGVVGQNLRFNINVDNAELAGLDGKKLIATLHTQDLSGKAIAVNDVAELALTANVKSDFVNPHKDVQDKDRKIHHSEEGYNHPYFLHLISQTAYDKGGFLSKIPVGGYTANADNPLTPVEIKYYFVTNADFDRGYRHNEVSRREAYSEFSDRLKKIMRETYDEFNAVSNVRFIETNNINEADTKIVYMNYDMRNPGSTLGGAAGIGENGGSVYMNSGTNGFGTGYEEYTYYTAFHEIYHTLSAKHTDEGFSSTKVRNSAREYYATAEDNSSEFSIMSGKMWDYHMAHDGLRGFSIYDLAFMHYRFGINSKVRSGNDVYGFNHYASQIKDGTVYIWDGAGVDTFDASYENEGVIVNLTPGSWNYYRSQLSDVFVIKENVIVSAYDYAKYFVEQDLTGVTVSGNIERQYAHPVYTKGQSFIGYGTQIENLNGSKFADILIGNKAENNISGGAGNDKIYGDAGNDYLDGGLGADEMEGGVGNDRYVVDNANDKVIEKEGEGDADSVYSSITYTLPEQVEQLYLIGSNNINATGNNLNNMLIGNDGDNVLRGAGGNDLLDGGRGNDTLIGGEGMDTFRFSSVFDGSIDTIDGFNVGEDKIQLDKEIFTALSGEGSVREHILYDSISGQLSYDMDGVNGVANAIHFATLSIGLDANTIRYEII